MSGLYKRYVDVIVRQNKSGEAIPQKLIWEDEKTYDIDKIIKVERRASQVGGCGIRYTCMIRGNLRYLFLEKNRWFIESYKP